jgi:hypothetical protein
MRQIKEPAIPRNRFTAGENAELSKRWPATGHLVILSAPSGNEGQA